MTARQATQYTQVGDNSKSDTRRAKNLEQRARAGAKPPWKRPINPNQPHQTPPSAAKAHTHRARAIAHAQAVTAGWMTERSRSPRPGPVWSVVCGRDASRMHAVLFREFLRVSPLSSAGAPLHAWHVSRTCVTLPSRRLTAHTARAVRARVSESGPSVPIARTTGGGVCANRSACLLALVMIPRFYPTLNLSHPY